MSRRAIAWAVAFSLCACAGSTIVERSAPQRPSWVEQVPAQGDWLYFVGTCTDLPSYQAAFDCARAEALTDLTAWVGARFSSHVYSRSSEDGRASRSTVYIDGALFLADLRRDDTYYEIREADWGRSYLVSVLIGYPRSEAEAERARMMHRLVSRVSSRTGAGATRWTI